MTPCPPSPDRAQCYGEARTTGLARIISLLENVPKCALYPSDEIIDVGSGFGRAAAYLRRATNVKRVVGIEINGCRARLAARRSGPGLELLHGDVRVAGLGNATHVYLTSQCFGSTLLADFFGRLAMQAPRLRCIIDLGSFDALSAQHLTSVSSQWGRVVAIGHEVRTTWDAHAGVIFVVRGPCNSSCSERAENRIARAAMDTEATDFAGPQSPWQQPRGKMWQLLS